MPFIFGPVEFTGLNNSEGEDPFDYEHERENVLSLLSRSICMPQNVCVHGFRVKIKQRNLKRRTSLLKHSRFLRNLEVTANPPPIKEVVQENDEEDEDDD